MKLRERGKIGLQNEIGMAMKSAWEMKTEKVYDDGKVQERESGGKIFKNKLCFLNTIKKPGSGDACL